MEAGRPCATECGNLSEQNFNLTRASTMPSGKSGVKDKRRRSSISRRVSFSATTRVKEFHEGHHEVCI